MVTDTGGIDDKSFNAAAWTGMQAAQAAGKAKVSYVQSKAETDYATNIKSLQTQNCKLIVTVGGLMASLLGRVPIPGATVEVDGLVLVAESAKGRRNRIGTVLVRRMQEEVQ